jgi:hypothetical protein
MTFSGYIFYISYNKVETELFSKFSNKFFNFNIFELIIPFQS